MRNFERNGVATAVCAALLSAWTSQAAADEGITTTLNGYGTLGGTFTSNNNYVYHHDANEFSGANEQFDIGLESRIGLQARVNFGSGFSVTAQELIRQRGSDVFSLGTEWLYLQYEPDSHWTLRAGRVALGAFLYSDSREVGYAQPWFRAPNDVYAAGQFQNLDGGQALWHTDLGGVELSLQGSFGNTAGQYSYSGTLATIIVKNAYNISASVEYQSFLFRVARTYLNLPESIALGPGFAVNFAEHDIFNSVAVQYDNGKAIVLSEWSKRSEKDAPVLGQPLAASSQWYVAGGWRFGPVTPLLMYSGIKEEQSLSYVPATYHTFAASLRYDVVRNIALKAQVSRAQAGNAEYWVVPNQASNERVNVYSVGADFVF
jgi:hypothetical protein